MSMNKEQAENAVIVSALIVGGIYMYRKLTEQAIPNNSKIKAVPPVGRFVTGWGVAFLVISAMAEASPGFGGAFALLVAAGDVMYNGTALASDINHKLSQPKAAAAGGTGNTATPNYGGGLQPGTNILGSLIPLDTPNPGTGTVRVPTSTTGSPIT